EADALIGTGNAGVAERGERTGTREILDVVARCAVGIDALHVDGIARSGRDVLDRQGQLTRPAPLVVGMTGDFSAAVVGRVIVMRRERRLEQAPGLVDAERRDQIRSNRAGIVARAVGTESAGTLHTEILHAGLIVGRLILGRQGQRHAVAELRGVGELVDAGDRATAADEAVEIVARIVGPRRRELRDRLTHGEAGELDEGVIDADRAGGDTARAGVVRSSRRSDRRVDRRACRGARAIAVRGPAEGRIEEGANHAVFGRGAGVDVQVFTRTPGVAVGEAVLRTAGAGVVAGVIRVGVRQNVDAQIAAQLDAGVGARNKVEARTIERADLDVLDCLGLDRKVGRHGSAARGENCRRAQQKALNYLHAILQVMPCSAGKATNVPLPKTAAAQPFSRCAWSTRPLQA
ncbi:hypothetical protein chiPu_0026630, partial [Chiloscyllium punctatum]|nr:hypothetical protein [Chiloscyllium punctatum]